MATVHTFRFEGVVTVSGQINATTANLSGLTANYVVYNNASGLLSSEELLAVSRGGLGGMTNVATKWTSIQGNVDPGGSLLPTTAVIPAVLGSHTGVFDPLAASVASIPNTLLVRNASGSVENLVMELPSSTAGTTVNMINTHKSYTVLAQCYARTTSNSATLFTLNAAGYGSNAAVYLRVYVSLMRSAASTDHGIYEIAARVMYTTGAPGAWTITTPLTCETKDLSTGLNSSTITITSSGDSLQVLTANATVSSIDWSGYITATIEKQLST